MFVNGSQWKARVTNCEATIFLNMNNDENKEIVLCMYIVWSSAVSIQSGKTTW
jgi:hypothetical protein